MSKALVVLSGGQDSTTCLFWAKKHFREVETITFNYGQRHYVEVRAARKIADIANVKNEVVMIPDVLIGASPLVNLANQVGEYENADSLPGGLEDTFVPARNLLFLTIAANRAYVIGANRIVTGVSEEDYGGYPDCRDGFIQAVELAVTRGLDRHIAIETPLIRMNKKATVELAMSLGGDCKEALSYSHTCYQGQTPPCGKCHACLLRQRGFDEAGVDDPLLVRLGL